MSAIPQTMKAVITKADKTIAIEEIPVPTIDDDEVLVKTTALAQNPTDWKHVQFVTNPGTIVGVDYAGVIAKVGKDVTTLAVGDRVAGFVHGGQYTDRGAFAQYVKTPAELTWKVPEGTITDEDAATLGCGAWTAVQTLFNRLHLVEPPKKTTKEEWVFIYGGATSVGMYAIQLAHLAGYKVATVASPKGHDLLKSYGADVVVDYKDPEAISKLKQATKESIHHALDTIAEAETQVFSVKTFGPGPGKLVTILNVKPEATKIRDDVVVEASLLYTALGRPFGNNPASPEDRKHMANFLKLFPDLVKWGALTPNPVKLFEGGFVAIPEGFEYMIAGKNRGEKIVYRV